MENKTMLKDEIKKVSVEIFLTTSIHAIPNIFRTKRKLIRIIWILCFLTSLSLCSYLIIQSIDDYLSFEVNSKIRKITEIPRKFPKITICNSNPFATEYAVNFLDSKMSNYSKIINEFVPILNYYNYYLFTNYIHMMQYAWVDLNDTDKKKLSQPLNKFLLGCSFYGFTCNYDDFEDYYHPYYGNCYSFNTGNLYDIQSVNQTGPAYAFKIEIFINDSELYNNLLTNRGVYIFIQEQNSQFYLYDYYTASTGKETSLIINQAINKKLKKPYSNCEIEKLDPDEHYSFVYKQFFKQNLSQDYNYQNCLYFCLQYYTLENCGCYDFTFNKFDKSNSSHLPCLLDNIENYECIFKILNEYLFNPKSVCYELCPLECETKRFIISSTLIDYPTKRFAKTLIENELINELINLSNKTFDDQYNNLKDHLLKVNIYFDSLDYDLIVENPSMTLVSLLSDIGGTMGLFLGISVLSLIELFELLIELCFIVFNNLKSNKIHHKSNI